MPRISSKWHRFTWGCELELGDVRKDLVVPPNLGSWEYAETDIVNQRPPYRFVAADPLGKDPPVGGEINLTPTKVAQAQVEKIVRLLTFFRQAGQEPTVSPCVMEFHIHVHVPGLRDDIAALKRLTK